MDLLLQVLVNGILLAAALLITSRSARLVGLPLADEIAVMFCGSKKSLASGVPMAFVVYADEGVRFYHYGDTAIFSDMKLQAELYKPTIGCVGIANPHAVAAWNPMPGRMLTAEMSPYEGALASQWLGLETVLPCHYLDADDPDVAEFERHLAALAARGEPVPNSIVMKPGETIEIPAGGGAARRVS